MPRPRKIPPRYLSHPSGKARVVWTSSTVRREKMLPGAINSPESLQAFARFQLELASSPEKPAPSVNGPTVVEVLAPYLRYAAEYHGPGSELKTIKSSLKTVRELYGADFGPKKLAAYREAFVRMGWSRPYVLTQAQRYAEGATGNPFQFGKFRVPFLYSTNGEVIWFHDVRNSLERSRRVADYPTPSALEERLARDFDVDIEKLFATPVQ